MVDFRGLIVTSGCSDKMAAMDCEMCQTTEGNEVTRVTVVDDNKKVLLDSFIKPYNPITDYHTRYSGITEEIMGKCDTRLEQVRKIIAFIGTRISF